MKASPLGRGVVLIEGLEQRRLLAADVTAALDLNGNLQIDGTRRSDSINVSLEAGEINVAAGAAAPQSFPAAGVNAIRINGAGGHDEITVAAGVAVPVTILGDKGNDTLTGGDGNDRIDGGGGRDVLSGGAGNDVLTGQGGRDQIRGDAGDDNCDGGGGSDDIDGGAGLDLLSGQGGRDTMRGGADDDDLDGGGGSDNVFGDDGNDRVRGGGGRDSCDGAAGDDELSGGPGPDSVRGGDGSDRFDDSDSRDRFEDRGDDDRSDDGVQIAASDMPVPVSQAFGARFPNVQVREVERETEDGTLVYKIDFFDTAGLRRRVVYDEAGNVFSDCGCGVDGGGGGDNGGNGGGDDNGGNGGGGGNGIPITPADLPPAVLESFNGLFPNATIGEVEAQVEDEGIVYKIDFQDSGNVRRRAEFSSSGRLIEQEVR